MSLPPKYKSGWFNDSHRHYLAAKYGSTYNANKFSDSQRDRMVQGLIRKGVPRQEAILDVNQALGVRNFIPKAPKRTVLSAADNPFVKPVSVSKLPAKSSRVPTVDELAKLNPFEGREVVVDMDRKPVEVKYAPNAEEKQVDELMASLAAEDTKIQQASTPAPVPTTPTNMLPAELGLDLEQDPLKIAAMNQQTALEQQKKQSSGFKINIPGVKFVDEPSREVFKAKVPVPSWLQGSYNSDNDDAFGRAELAFNAELDRDSQAIKAFAAREGKVISDFTAKEMALLRSKFKAKEKATIIDVAEVPRRSKPVSARQIIDVEPVETPSDYLDIGDPSTWLSGKSNRQQEASLAGVSPFMQQSFARQGYLNKDVRYSSPLTPREIRKGYEEYARPPSIAPAAQSYSSPYNAPLNAPSDAEYSRTIQLAMERNK